MNNDWQTWTAAGVVVATALIFARRMWKGRKKHGGCNTCGSGGPPLKRL
jgi:hypothetical protein